MRKFFRSTYYTGVVIFFLLVALIGFTQTKVFRSYLRGMMLEKIAPALHGELVMGELEGNLFTGFSVNNVVVRESGADLLAVERIEARYDPLSLLARRIALSRITLVRPRIQILRSTDGTWNVDRLIRTTPADTTPSPWVITLRQALINEGIVTIVDSLSLAKRELDLLSHPGGPARPNSMGEGTDTHRAALEGFDYANLTLESLRVDASVRIESGNISASVRSLSFHSPQPPFTLKRLSGNFELTSTLAGVSGLFIESENSRLRLDASLDGVDITALESLSQLEHVPVSLKLEAEKIDFGELKLFIGSPIDFLDRSVACRIDAGGSFGHLEISRAHIRSPLSVIQAAGSIGNLHRPADLQLDLAFLDNVADPKDVNDHLPGLNLPDLSAWGAVRFNLWFRGKPTAFAARLITNSGAGSLEFDGELDARGEVISYAGTILSTHFDLGRVLGDSILASDLNAKVTVRGSGTTLGTLAATVRAELDTSRFYDLPVRASVVVADAANRVLRARMAAALSATRIDLSGVMEFPPEKAVSYDVEGRVNSLNFAEVLKDRQYSSDLSFQIRAKGSGLRADAVQSQIDLKFFRSSFGDVRFDGGGFNAELTTADHEGHSFRIRSDALDAEIEGTFTLGSFVSAIVTGSTLLSESIAHRLTSLDSLRAFTATARPPSPFRPSRVQSSDPLKARLVLTVKDFYPIGVFFGRRMAGSLQLNGAVESGVGGIQFEGKTHSGRFLYSDRDLSIEMENVDVGFRIAGLTGASTPESLHAVVDVRARAFMLDSLLFSDLRLDAKTEGDSGAIAFSALIDSLVKIGVRGTSTAESGFLLVTLPQFQFDFGSYAFENIEPVQMRMGRDGLQIANLWMRHEAEELHAQGYFHPGGISDLTISVRNLLLGNVTSFTRTLLRMERGATFGGMVNAVLSFRGSFDHPNMSLELNASGVRYRETVFGQVVARLSYFERLLSVFTEFRSRPDDISRTPDLLISGVVPYDLALAGGAGRRLEGEMDLQVQTGGFRLEFLDPFIAGLRNLSGLVVCDMRMHGTVESPSYEGSMSLQDARFVFMPLNMSYIVNGKLIPHGRQIALENVTISNIAQDRPDGRMTLAGTFTLEGIQIKEFDLNANGQLLVMKETARRPEQSLYGDLFGASGPGGVRWHGKPSRSYISGTIFVRNANLTLPPTREPRELPGNRIAVTLIDDGVASREENNPEDDSERSLLALAGAQERRSDASLAGSPLVQPALPHTAGAGLTGPVFPRPLPTSDRSFLDEIVYDLVIETQGVVQLRFIFNHLTNEELFADLKGRLSFARAVDQTRLTGEVELGTRSYYNSVLKKLDASGKLRFTGDPLNPELDVVARYEGVYRARRDTSIVLRSAVSDQPMLEEKVVVKLLITGTRDQPKVKTELERYDAMGNLIETEGDVEADAFAFLVTGSFRDDLTQQDRLSLASSSVLGGLTSSVLSGPLTDLLRREFGVIRSVDVLYYGGSFQESADVRVTGEVGDAVFRLGGRVFSDINNANVSVQLPMSGLLGSEKWRNLVLELERRVEGIESADQRRESRGLRLLYRITF